MRNYRFTDDERAQLRRMAERGESASDIARHFGRRRSSIIKRATMDGVVIAGTKTRKQPSMPQVQGDDYQPRKDLSANIDECYRVIRERQANGGPGWEPK
jgi:IS30 family transposase